MRAMLHSWIKRATALGRMALKHLYPKAYGDLYWTNDEIARMRRGVEGILRVNRIEGRLGSHWASDAACEAALRGYFESSMSQIASSPDAGKRDI